jgi:hypothetical protein
MLPAGPYSAHRGPHYQIVVAVGVEVQGDPGLSLHTSSKGFGSQGSGVGQGDGRLSHGKADETQEQKGSGRGNNGRAHDVSPPQEERLAA